MRPHLPPMTTLRAFEAAARHQSFTRAAQELNLTQTAVSHRIRKLEELLGAKLFVRDGNAVRLTDLARDYLRTIRPSILQISDATGRAKDRGRTSSLFVACMPTFAMKCLIPNLGDFCRKHPDTSLRLRTVMSGEGLGRADYDVAIRYGSGDWPGLVAQKLCDEEVFPVCSPSLRGAGLRTPRDLRRHTVIHTALSFLDGDWPVWLEAAGEKDLQFAHEITCDLFLPAVEAAISGLGLVLGRTPLINSDLAAKTLVEPFSVRIPSRMGYYIVSPRELSDLPSVRRFTDWALARFGSRDFLAS